MQNAPRGRRRRILFDPACAEFCIHFFFLTKGRRKLCRRILSEGEKEIKKNRPVETGKKEKLRLQEKRRRCCRFGHGRRRPASLLLQLTSSTKLVQEEQARVRLSWFVRSLLLVKASKNPAKDAACERATFQRPCDVSVPAFASASCVLCLRDHPEERIPLQASAALRFLDEESLFDRWREWISRCELSVWCSSVVAD